MKKVLGFVVLMLILTFGISFLAEEKQSLNEAVDEIEHLDLPTVDLPEPDA